MPLRPEPLRGRQILCWQPARLESSCRAPTSRNPRRRDSPKRTKGRRTPGAEPPRPAPESIRFSFVLRHAQPGGVRRAYLVVHVAIVGVERRRAVVSVLSIVRGPGLRGVLLAGVAIELFARIEMRAALAALEILVVL